MFFNFHVYIIQDLLACKQQKRPFITKLLIYIVANINNLQVSKRVSDQNLRNWNKKLNVNKLQLVLDFCFCFAVPMVWNMVTDNITLEAAEERTVYIFQCLEGDQLIFHEMCSLGPVPVGRTMWEEECT